MHCSDRVHWLRRVNTQPTVTEAEHRSGRPARRDLIIASLISASALSLADILRRVSLIAPSSIIDYSLIDFLLSLARPSYG